MRRRCAFDPGLFLSSLRARSPMSTAQARRLPTMSARSRGSGVRVAELKADLGIWANDRPYDPGRGAKRSPLSATGSKGPKLLHARVHRCERRHVA
jgi:hypothetical protein